MSSCWKTCCRSLVLFVSMMGVPVLGICYGQQTMVEQLGAGCQSAGTAHVPDLWGVFVTNLRYQI